MVREPDVCVKIYGTYTESVKDLTGVFYSARREVLSFNLDRQLSDGITASAGNVSSLDGTIAFDITASTMTEERINALLAAKVAEVYVRDLYGFTPETAPEFNIMDFGVVTESYVEGSSLIIKLSDYARNLLAETRFTGDTIPGGITAIVSAVKESAGLSVPISIYTTLYFSPYFNARIGDEKLSNLDVLQLVMGDLGMNMFPHRVTNDETGEIVMEYAVSVAFTYVETRYPAIVQGETYSVYKHERASTVIGVCTANGTVEDVATAETGNDSFLYLDFSHQDMTTAEVNRALVNTSNGGAVNPSRTVECAEITIAGRLDGRLPLGEMIAFYESDPFDAKYVAVVGIDTEFNGGFTQTITGGRFMRRNECDEKNAKTNGASEKETAVLNSRYQQKKNMVEIAEDNSGGVMQVLGADGTNRVTASVNQSGGRVEIYNSNGEESARLGHNGSHGGYLIIKNSAGNPVFDALPSAGTGEPGIIRVIDGQHATINDATRVQIAPGSIYFYENGSRVASYGETANFKNLFPLHKHESVAANSSYSFEIPDMFRGLILLQSPRSNAALYSVVSTSSGNMVVVPLVNTTPSVSVTTATNELVVTNGYSYNVYVTILGGNEFA